MQLQTLSQDRQLYFAKKLRECRRAGVILAERTVGAWVVNRKRERKMKTRNVITLIGAVGLAAIIFNLNAGAPWLSPRAKDRQIKAPPTLAHNQNLATGDRNFQDSPAALDNGPETLPTTKDDVRLVTSDRNASGCTRATEPIQKTAVAGGCCATAKTAHAAPPTCCAK